MRSLLPLPASLPSTIPLVLQASSSEHRTTVQVVCPSYGRTGTMSMKAALEILGFGPCYHSEIRRECTLNFKGSVLQHGERDIVAICSRDI